RARLAARGPLGAHQPGPALAGPDRAGCPGAHDPRASGHPRGDRGPPARPGAGGDADARLGCGELAAPGKVRPGSTPAVPEPEGAPMSHFTSLATRDVRFPTSRSLDGSDAMNPEPDYSAAYVVLATDAGDGLEGHGFAFTTGRGNDVQAVAIQALAPWIVGRDAEDVLDHLGDVYRELVGDPQLRWLGPEKGVGHM